MRVAVDDVRSQWLQAEERSKQLNERLSTAFADITAKDNLVKQHVKVAEEAVTGTNSFPLLRGHHRIHRSCNHIPCSVSISAVNSITRLKN